ncbi:glycosyltransferase family 2 protein [Anaerocolumna sp. MB42-C2]|uniref:glycosyltransferase family 2 protein n=1 Tax=Anaerocolumna sp. MB42-C2 TaxID=3070997 RepID=UPI0027DFC395|nr:glycosyltransferase family 2 protein [Anaerocolumna sp. MB42-C2]WMJ90223.1 glycosyltransferase family 2 protein [Anaerocolumna sp. MB42-C2]
MENIYADPVKVSVILPTYNRIHTLKRSIISVLNQGFTDYELLIIDDGSTDGTKEFIADIMDERIHYIKSPVNRGAANARNIGIRASKGKYIAFQDSDDEWLPDKLEKQVVVMDEADMLTGMVYTRLFYDLGDKGRIEYPPESMSLDQKSGYIYEQILHRNLVGTPTMLIRRECFNKVGMFNTQLRKLEDWELCIRIAKDYKIILVDELLLKAYLTPGSLSSDTVSNVQATLSMLKIYKEEYIKYNLLEEKVNEIKAHALKINKADEVNKLIETVLL